MSDYQGRPNFSGCSSNSKMSVSVSVSTPPPIQNQIPPDIFLCPISLELMNDPVILSTGHTYDRRSIERWFKTGNKTCPQTRQRVRTTDLIPNVVLKDYIRHWQVTSTCVPNNGRRCFTSLSLVDLSDLHAQLMLAMDGINVESDILTTLTTLQTMAKANDTNRKLICDGGALSILKSMLSRSSQAGGRGHGEEVCSKMIGCGALGLLAALSMNDEAKMQLPTVGLSIVPSLSWFLRRGDLDAKVNVARIIECMVVEDDCLLALGAEEGLIQGLVEMIKDPQHVDVTARACLRSLYAISLPKRNRRIAIEAGAIPAVIELLTRAKTEVADGALAILALMSTSGCAEGLFALSDHEAQLAIPMLVRSILKYTNSGTEHAVSVLHAILMTNLNPLLQREAVKAGAIVKLLLAVQISERNSETKFKAQKLLKSLQLSRSDEFFKTIYGVPIHDCC